MGVWIKRRAVRRTFVKMFPNRPVARESPIERQVACWPSLRP